jgi:hypothetical protein
MQEAWIQLLCPECGETWEANPADLPAPRERLHCTHCEAHRPTAEFARTDRDYEILKQFHG